MRKVLTGLALLAPAIATAQVPYRGQSGYDTGPVVNCTALDGSGAARCLMPGQVLYDTNGNPLGTAANPVVTSSAGSTGTPTGTAGNPNANVVTVQGINGGTPQATNITDSRPPIPNLYIATAAGTGYAVGDILDKIVVSQASTGAFVNSYWINRTQGASIAAPAAGSFVAYFATQANQQTQISAEQAILANQTNNNQKTQIVDSGGNGYAAGAETGTFVGGSGQLVFPTRSFLRAYDPSINDYRSVKTDLAGLMVVMKGSATLATGQVSVGTSATLIRAADSGRTSITVNVGAANSCAFGNSGVTLTTGYLLPAVAGSTDTTATAAALYGVCSATTTVSYKVILP